MADNTGNLIGIFISVIILVIAVIAIVWALNNKQKGVTCSKDNECFSNQTCSNGICTYKTCSISSDCGTDQTCTSGFCYPNSCVDNTNCSNSNICEKGFCVPFGTQCDTTSNCFNSGLICDNNRCIQCRIDSDCPSGDVCSVLDGKCYANCTEAGGNSSCPTGTFCTQSNICCPSQGESCVNNSCSAGNYCVDQFCACAPGDIGQSCRENRDCLSNTCLRGVCATSGAICNANFSTSGTAPCTDPNNPFCVNGQCMNYAAILQNGQSIGAPCACNTFSPTGTNVCNSQYYACNLTGGVTGSLLYCVNNFCSFTPGPAGSHCTQNSDCQPLGTPPVQNCKNNICSGN